jgi:hypothetical protein
VRLTLQLRSEIAHRASTNRFDVPTCSSVKSRLRPIGDIPRQRSVPCLLPCNPRHRRTDRRIRSRLRLDRRNECPPRFPYTALHSVLQSDCTDGSNGPTRNARHRGLCPESRRERLCLARVAGLLERGALRGANKGYARRFRMWAMFAKCVPHAQPSGQSEARSSSSWAQSASRSTIRPSHPGTRSTFPDTAEQARTYRPP